jgi:hypothetical protein
VREREKGERERENERYCAMERGLAVKKKS